MNLEVIASGSEEGTAIGKVIAELGRFTDIFAHEPKDETTSEVIVKPCREAGFSICRISQKAAFWDQTSQKQTVQYQISYREVPDLCRGLLFLAGQKPDFLQNASEQNIREQCAFREFGVMLDLSRNAVLKVDTVKQMICYAACLGMNFVGLYMEDTFFVEEEPYLGYMRGRVTKEEIHELDTYAAMFGIELRPYIQTLAHLNQIARYADYEDIIDTKDILLVGEDRTREFLDHVIRSVSECFTTDFIHVGMDEAELLGAGKYLTRHGAVPKSRIMTEHLHIVLEICEKYHRRPQIWSDMFVHMMDSGDTSFEIPENLTLVHWDYYSTEEQHYVDNLAKHRKLSNRIGFAGGAWKWTGFAPHNAYSILAGRASIAACMRENIESYTITCWGDDGAEASCFSVLPALYEDAAQAFKSTMARDSFQRLTGYDFDDFMKIDLVNPYLEEGTIHNNCSKYLLYNDPLIGTFDSVVKADTPERFHQTAEHMQRNASHGRLHYLFRSMELLCCVLEQKVDLGLRIRTSYAGGRTDELRRIAEEEIPALRQKLDAFYAAFERQWKTENKSFGFEVQTIRLGGLDRRLADTGRLLREYAEGQLTAIPELEEPYQPFGYLGGNEIATLNYNLWSDIVTTSVIG